MEIVLKVIVIALLVYLFLFFFPGVCAFFSIFKRKNGQILTEETIKGTYYEPFKDEVLGAKAYFEGLEREDVEITSHDGYKLRGYYYNGGFSSTVILFHGFKADALSQMSFVGQEFYKNGFNLLFVYQRAHGKSDGKYSGIGIKEQYDIIKWIEFLKARGEKHITLYGMSMGSAAIGYAADRLDNSVVKAVVMDCGFSSPAEQIKTDCKKWHIPWITFGLPMTLMARIVLKENISKKTWGSLEKATVPIYFIHGTKDESVPLSSGQDSFKHCSSEKDCQYVEGAKHTVSLLVGGEGAKKHVIEFVKKYNT